MRHSHRFLSTFGSVRPVFGGGGRQKSNISPSFCLFSRPRTPILESQVDKNQTFPPFLSTFRTARPDFGESGRQKSDVSPVFCLLSVPHAPNLETAVEHFSKFWIFCSTFGAARPKFGVGGRTFFQFWMILFYFRSRAGRIWRQR